MKLYIIGNGFDIAHGLSCRFSDFYTYLETSKKDVLYKMEDFYDTSYESELWKDFEVSLEENIIYDKLTENIREFTPNVASDNFSDGDWFSSQIQIENDCNDLLSSIRLGFEEWISSLDINDIQEIYNLEENAYFFTFNYTEVLESVYQIPSANILHIHNKVGEELIFGHGKHISDFDVREALYGHKDAFLNIDEYGNVESNEIGHEKYAEDAVETFHEKMRKKTSEVIESHSSFFNKISNVTEVYVIGHSYNEIDFPYFEVITASINKSSTWNLSCYSADDNNAAQSMIKKLNIDKHLVDYT